MSKSITPPHIFCNNFNKLAKKDSTKNQTKEERRRSGRLGMLSHTALFGALVCSLQLASATASHATISFIGSGPNSDTGLDSGSKYDSTKDGAPETGKPYDEIYGGKIDNGSSTAAEAKENILQLGSEHQLNAKDGKVYGGYAKGKTADASGNKVKLDGVKVVYPEDGDDEGDDDGSGDWEPSFSVSVYGGYAYSDTSSAGTVTASSNSVQLLNGNVSFTLSANDYTGSSSAEIYGGYAYTSGANPAEASSNKVKIDNLEVKLSADEGVTYGAYSFSVYGGSAYVDSSYTATSTASSNNVKLSNVKVSIDTTDYIEKGGVIYGGCASVRHWSPASSDDTDVTVTASSNRVRLATVNFPSSLSIYGGYAYAYTFYGYTSENDGDATLTYTASDNKVVLVDVTSDSLYVNGGWANDHMFEGNSGSGNADITVNATASGNIVKLTKVNSSEQHIYGGYAYAYCHEGSGGSGDVDIKLNATSSNNKVRLADVDVSGSQTIYGGYTYSYMFSGIFSATSNSGDADVTLTEVASGNTVMLNDVNVSGSQTIYGGYSHDYVYAGIYSKTSDSKANATFAFNGTSSNNKVKLTDVDVSGSQTIYGGSAGRDSVWAECMGSSSHTASDNTVKLTRVTAGSQDIYGGNSCAGVTLSSGTSNLDDTDAADTEPAAVSVKAEATGNKVKLDTVTASSQTIYGGWTYASLSSGSGSKDVKGTASVTADSSNNKVKLTNVSNSGSSSVYGGYAYAYSTSSITSNTDGSFTVTASSTASNNRVAIYGGSFKNAKIYAGYSHADYANGTAAASNNTVALYPYIDEGADTAEEKMPELDGAEIWGGYVAVSGDTTKGEASGNTLEFNAVKNIKASNIYKFSNLTFTLPSMTAGEAVLTLTGGKATDITGAKVTVTNEIIDLKGADGGQFQEGDEIVLLKNDSGITTTGVEYNSKEFTGRSDKTQQASRTLLGQTGVSLQYTLELEDTGTSIVLKCTDSEEIPDPEPTPEPTPEPDPTPDTKPDQDTTPEHKTDPSKKKKSAATVLPGTKAIAEGAAAGLALASEAANAGIELARSFSLQAHAITPFVHVQGASVTHETGSNVHLNSVSLIAGVGTGLDTGAGNLSLGAFFEYGKGSYTTSNTFDNAPNVNGDGNAWYMGGGLVANMEFLKTGPGHFYVEGSAHMGQLHNEYDSRDLHDVGGRIAKFDLDSPYYALHGGAGYVWDIMDGHQLDVYGQYIWTRVQGTDETLTTGDKFEFDDMDSSRVRAGARYTYKGHECFRPYIGAAWEHEFAGSCESTAYGHPVAAPSFEGDTGMGELGIKMTPSKDLPLTVNLGVQGYVGQKQGISGNCMVKYEF